jgi:hypothetical protein
LDLGFILFMPQSIAILPGLVYSYLCNS